MSNPGWYPDEHWPAMGMLFLFILAMFILVIPEIVIAVFVVWGLFKIL